VCFCGHHSFECTGAHDENLHISQSVYSEMMIASCIACLSAFKSTGHLLYFTSQINPTEKSHMLLGPVNEVAMVHHQNKEAPTAEIKGEAWPC
jgi:hypothetical protein